MLLDVKNLSTVFPLKKGTVRAVDNVSFCIDKGESLAIVGESGSGKSVTSLSVMGLISKPGRVGSGSIVYKDSEDLRFVTKQRMRELRGNEISMIFQEPMTSLNPVYTIRFQLVEAIRTHMGMSKDEAADHAVQMLELAGIPSARQRLANYPHELSGGMRQRVMIAMALSCNPELLIADEPTTALDVTIQAQIMDLLGELRSRLGMSLILITHDMGIVAESCERVVVMYCGQVVEEAGVRDLFRGPMHPYTVGLLASIPRMDRVVRRLTIIPGVAPDPLDLPKGCAFYDRCGVRMARCGEETPELIENGGRSVRCFRCQNGGCADG